MSFIKKIIGPDETLIGISSAHWIYGATGIFWLAGMMMLGLVLDYYATGLFDYLFMDTGAFAVNRIADALFWIPTALGGVMFFLYFIMMIAPEIALTSKRVIYKRGIVFVDVKEVDLEEIKAAHVDSGYFGRLFNYGFVVFDARFVTGMDLPAIGQPYRFVKALNDMRSHLKEDSMTVVLEGVGDAVQQEVAAQTGKAKVDAAPEQKKRKRKLRMPRLSNKRYDDKMTEEPHIAIHEIAHEAKENTQHAVKTSPLEELQKHIKPEEGVPVVFGSELHQREKQLRNKIKENFSTTH